MESSDAVTLPLDFHAVYETWFEPVSRWISALGGPRADREDLVQEVFVVVHRRLPDFDGRNLGGWLYQIARRRVRDFRRLAWFRHVLRVREPLPELEHRGASAVESLETKQKGQLLERALLAMNRTESTALVLFELDGLSGEEIAKIQSVSLNTVFGRIHHGRKKLRACLASSHEYDSPVFAGGPRRALRSKPVAFASGSRV